MLRRAAIAMLAGGVSVLAFAPFGAFPLAFVSLVVLVWVLEREPRPGGGFLVGFAWGLGAFVFGVSWLYIALNRYGGVPVPVAALAIVLFCAYLALYPALVAALYVRLRRGGPFAHAALFAGLWVVAEWLRGWVFTGFPWLAIGYSQTPPSPLAGYLPVIGVYGVGGLVAFASVLLALVPLRAFARSGRILAPMVLILLLGFALGRIAWTTPSGEPLRVALVQTNIEQGLKWEPGMLAQWLEVNAHLAGRFDADLVVLPETTLPLLVEQLPQGYLEHLAGGVRARDGDLIVGVFDRDARGQIFNAAISLGTAPRQMYAKQHLVPFGEYSPPLFGWFYALAEIPMSDQTPGSRDQRPMRLGEQRIAINICYEDLFGRVIRRGLPEATILLNISNLAWYGRSLAQPQHLQIARVRAIEAGRTMLRSTNTGMTAVVNPDGSVAGVMPQFERGALQMEVMGHQGLTPYARWGDGTALVLALLALALGVWPKRNPGSAASGDRPPAA